MYVRDLIVENLGPIEHLHLKPRFNDTGLPVPIALVGPNGAGKSLVLSVIFDAFVEAHKKVWRKLHEVKHEQLMRLGSHSYTRAGSDFSHSHLVLGNEPSELVYDDVSSTLKGDPFNTKYPDLRIQGRTIGDDLEQGGGFFRDTATGPNAAEQIKRTVFAYFPYFRYERPAWLNPESELTFSMNGRMQGVSQTPVVQVDVVDRTCQWLLGLVLDRELYEKDLQDVSEGRQILKGYSGPNHSTLGLVNQVLTAIIRARDPQISAARLGIGKSPWRRIAVVSTRDGAEREVCPHVRQMSSGELMILALFCTIIRTYDSLLGGPPAQLADVTGVVVVDEVDLHLHIEQQRSVLPYLLRMFPGVQFIVSTHSPFFVLGMTENVGGELDIFALPEGRAVSASDFSEFQSGYDAFFAKNEQFKTAYETLSAKLKDTTRALVVTEGKTDWKHLKSALSRLKLTGKHVGLDIEFLQYGSDVEMGDSQLCSMCQQFAKARHARKVIFIFDRDVPKIVRDMAGDPATGYKTWSPEVYSMCIPIPAHRAGYVNISIEFYYSDDEIRTTDPDTGKRLLFTNEVEHRVRPSKTGKTTHVIEADPDSEFEKKIHDQDCDGIVDASGSPVAHSKAIFAQKVLDGAPGFGGFGINEFCKIFEVIDRIIAA